MKKRYSDLVKQLTSFYLMENGYDALAHWIQKDSEYLQRVDELIDLADRTYYNGAVDIADVVLGDDLYDWLREFRNNVCIRYGVEPRCDKPGAAPPSRVETPHPPPFQDLLGGIDLKLTSVHDFIQYLDRNFNPYDMLFIQPKIDGISALVVVDYRKTLMVTRGRSGYGVDITGKLPVEKIAELYNYLQRYRFEDLNARGLSNPHAMESLNPKETLSLAFKLEIYVSLRDLPTLNDERIANGEPPYSNCRSAASGIIGRLDNVYDRYLRFAQLGIAEVYDSYRNEHFNLARRLPARPFAKQLAPPNIYTTPVFPKCGTVAKQVYEIKNQLSRDRNECIANFTHPMCCAEAPMDGLVIYDADTFKELCAYKFDPESKTTRVVNVELNMGSTGAIVPTVILEPVVLNGTNQSRVGGTNFELIAERGIGPGAVVEISLNNDVIPYISQVLVPTRVAPHRPVFCPCCRHVLAREHRNLLCVNDNCEELRVQRLNSYIRSFMKNDGIGEAVARKLCAVPGFAPHHLYAVFANADIEYLRTVGLGDSVSTTLVNTGAELLRRPTADWEIVAALWFPGVGEKRAQKICSEIGIHSPECFAITGIDPRDVRLQSAYRELHAILQQLASFAIVASTYGKAQAYKLHVAITGTIPGVDRDALTLQLSNIGIKVSNAVTSKTQMLIVGDNPGRAKTTAAAKLGIPVYTYPQFVDYVRRLFTPNFSI